MSNLERAFCREEGCNGVMERDHRRGEMVCSVCGVVDDQMVFELGKTTYEPWEKHKLTPLEERLLDAGVDVLVLQDDDYISRNTKELSLGLLDRRIELIYRSLIGKDRIIDLSFSKHALLRDRYNERFKPEIEYDDARHSYERFVKKQNALIDRFLHRSLSEMLNGDSRKRIRQARCLANDGLTEKLVPGMYLYDGTARNKLNFSYDNCKKFNDHIRPYLRKEEVRRTFDLRTKETLKAPSKITRYYKSLNNKNLKIVFEIFDNEIRLSGDEIDKKFETFYLRFAIKHGYIAKCPDIKKLCYRRLEEFYRVFREYNCFYQPRIYDARAYVEEIKDHIKGST